MSVLDDFLAGAPDGVAPTLAALACAESLTDDVARAIYKKVPVPGLDAEQFLSAFKYSGLTEPRNSEWNLNHELRFELVRSNFLPADAKHSVHRYLAELGAKADFHETAGRTVPTYLFSEAGIAYHLAGAGKVEAALDHYSRASRGPFNGAQWLGAKLVEEQEETGVIPEGQIETTFLRAWVMLRQGCRKEAMPLFEKVAETDVKKREVAISLHLFANSLPPRRSVDAERKLWRAIEIAEALGERHGVAQYLHSLANLLSKRDGRWDEAEKAYRESIEMLQEVGDRFGEAQTLHSLANLLSKQDGRCDEAEKAYHESIEIGEKIRRDNHVAQTLRSYALHIERRDPKQALELLTRSLEINERRGNRRFANLVRQTIGQVRKRNGL